MEETSIPRMTHAGIFLRFLRFGALAWGGPVAQIAMIQRQLVEKERWISMERFHRALAVYQALPGPEAHELCVYFGMLARGRIGGLLAGLGFMLPGLVLMLLASWLYVASGGAVSLEGRAIFAAMQAAVLALIVRAVLRISARAMSDRWLLAVALASLGGSLVGVHFAIGLGLGGAFYLSIRKGQRAAAALLGLVWLGAIAFGSLALASVEPHGAVATAAPVAASLPMLAFSGLKGGLLTFGGAYTAIPFLQEDAVVNGAWMTDDQFLDGLAIGGILPAPLIIFGTFVGYLGGGWLGALAVTAGIFLPAFGFTLIAHEALERITGNEKFRHFLAGMTAGVVGLIAATTLQLVPAGIGTPGTGAVFAGALALLYLVRHELQVVLVMGCAALAGWLLL